MAVMAQAERSEPLRSRTRLADCTLAEAVRISEEHFPQAHQDDRAIIESILRDFPESSFEARIIERARRMPSAENLRQSMASSADALRIVILLAGIVALVAGALAARAALREHTASIIMLIFGLLGVQTLMLLVSIVVLVAGRGPARGGMLGRIVISISQWLAQRAGRAALRHESVAAIEAMSVVYASGAAGRWTLAAISHLLWTIFNLSALAMLTLLFLGEGYQFRWDSTWLSEDSYASLISIIAAGPEAVGFTVPDAAQIASSRFTSDARAVMAQDAAAREAWSWLFFGSVVVYGFVPRAALLVLSWLLRRRALSGYRLDLDRPGFAVLRHRLMPEAAKIDGRAIATSTPGPIMNVAASDARHDLSNRPPGAPAMVGLEMRTPKTGWPPALDRPVKDLGLIDGGEDERRALDHLTGMESSPSPLILGVEMGRAPDRGVERSIAELHRAGGGRSRLVITGGRGMAKLHGVEAIARRMEDWRSLAARAGVGTDDVAEIDLDLLTDETRWRLHAIAGWVEQGESRELARTRRLDAACDLISHHAEKWHGEPDDSEHAELHIAIARLYGHESKQWGSRFARDVMAQLAKGSISAESFVPAMKNAAESMRALLPASLRLRPTWLAAGGIAGALGCLGVAIAFAPAALAALPMWSLAGAGIGAVLGSGSADVPSARDDGSQESIARDDIIRSALYFAFVLELQGRQEASISRVLDATLSDLREIESTPTDRLRIWLDEARHRFDLALAAEERSA